MSRVSSFSPRVDKRFYRFGLIRGLNGARLNCGVLGLFVVAWILGSTGGTPCCCQTAYAAYSALIQANDVANEARAALPACCVQHAVAASRSDACDGSLQPCASDTQSTTGEGLNCDCPCCVSSAPAAMLQDQSLRIERHNEWAAIDWPSSLAYSTWPEVNVFVPEFTGPPAFSAPERLARLSRWIK